MYRIQFIIGPVRVVVKENEMFDLGRLGQLARLANQAVPPATLLGHVLLHILGVVNEDLGILTELNKFIEIGGFGPTRRI